MHEKDIGYYIKTINDKLKIRADADLKRHNLTLSQSRVLAFLESNGGTATQKEIELYLDVSHPTVVGIVSRMEQNGFISCRTDEKDKRNKITELTAHAKEICEDMRKSICESENKMLASLSEEDIGQFKKILLVIYKNLE